MKVLDSLRDLLKLVRLSKPLLFLGVLFLISSAGVNLLIPKLVGDIFNTLESNFVLSDIHTLSFYLALVFLGRGLFTYGHTVCFGRLTVQSLTDLRQRVYGHAVKLPVFVFKKKNVSEITSRISADIQRLENFFNQVIPTLLSQSIVGIGALVMTFIISWKLAGIILIIFPLVLFLSGKLTNGIKGISSELQGDTARSNIIIQESLTDIYAVKSFTNEPFQVQKFKRMTNSVTKLGTRLILAESRYELINMITMGLLIVFMIWRSAVMISQGTLGQGDVIAFATYLLLVFGCFHTISKAIADVQKSVGSVESILELLGNKPEELEQTGNVDLSGSLRFENVNFSYPDNPKKFILKNINFEIPQGERWALVGSSGSGKSTIASLVLQFYQPTTGKVYFDDIEMTKLSLYNIRKNMAVVPQSSSLFTGTIRENIMYGRLDATEEEFQEVAIEASVDEFVKDLTDGYATEVGENGMRLSGGQRQRILLARAMLKNPKILILDEATSALDSETEMLVQVAIYLMTQKCTSLTIAHRLSTVKTADRILVMDQGEIIEQGTYEELMADDNSHFRHLNFLSLDTKES